MKKQTIFLLLFSALTHTLSAQHILKSSVIFNNEVHPTEYIFIPSDSKVVENDWKTYLSKTGEVSEEKGQFTSQIESNKISRSLDKIVSYVQDYKSFSAVYVILLDENGRSLAADEINVQALEILLYEFYDVAYFNQEVRMTEADLELAQKLNDDAEKAESRAERNLAANLRAQEKLGKKLDETPEKLSEIIQEKNEVYQKLLQKDGNDETQTVEADGELEKEFAKKEKILLKTKSTEKRKSNKLSKKEAEFEELTNKLLAARSDLSKAIQVLESKKLVLQDLKKK
jgi:hypothetical protein